MKHSYETLTGVIGR